MATKNRILNLTLNKLLWFDGLAALSYAILVLILMGPLSDVFGIPIPIMKVQIALSFLYASYSTSLAWNISISRMWIKCLALLNSAYGSLCLFIAVFCDGIMTLGLVFLILEATFIFILAYTEWRWIRRYKDSVLLETRRL